MTAVGRVAQLGELYDARSEQFLGISLFKNKIPDHCIITTHNGESKMKFIQVNTYKEKFEHLGVTASLKLSVLGGLISMEGSAKFLKDTKSSYRSAKVSLTHSAMTLYEEITINNMDLHPSIDTDVLAQIAATHVVVGTQWGANVFVSVEDSNYEEEDKQHVEGSLKASLNVVIAKLTGGVEVDFDKDEKNQLNKFEFEIFGDVVMNETVENVTEAIRFMKLAPGLIKETNGGKGNAIRYTLIPVDQLRKLWKTDLVANAFYKQIGEDTIKKCVELFDQMNFIDQQISDLKTDVLTMEPYIATSKVKNITNLKHNFELYETSIKRNLAAHLIQVRSGNESVDKLEQLLLDADNDPYACDKVELTLYELGHIKREISLIKLMQSMNVTILNKNTVLQQYLWKYYANDVYILFFNYDDSNLDDTPVNLFRGFIEDRAKFTQDTIFTAVDYTILDESQANKFGDLKTKPKIIKFNKVKNVKEFIDHGDVVKEFSFMQP